MAPGEPILRPATMDDADLLLAWANDPAARAASFSPRPIERPEHVGWLAGRLGDPACAIWIGLQPADRRAVGVVRVERDASGMAVVSIAVDPDARGRGNGAALLRAGIAAARSTLQPAGFRAFVRPENTASIRLFEAVGFRRQDPGEPDRLAFEL